MNRWSNEGSDRRKPGERSSGRRGGGSSPSPRRRKTRNTETRSVSVIGLIGGIGSGKSTIARKLADLGATVIDADSVGHALLNQGPVQEVLVRRFGPDILAPPDETGSRLIDRRVLGTIVFSDESARKVLEEAMHPRMRTTFERVISRVARQVFPKPGALKLPPPVIILDAAVLYEAGWDDMCDYVIFIDASRKDRLRRVKEHRNWETEELDRREAAQWPVDLKRNQADFVIKNPDGVDPATLDAEIAKVWQRINPTMKSKPTAKTDFSQLIEDEIDGMAPYAKHRRRGARPPQNGPAPKKRPED
ncbi:MAG: dephospho-CoA kinase [Isosphaeraceae bacterium]